MKTTLIIASLATIVALLPAAYFLYKKRKTKRDLKRKLLAEGNGDYSETAKNMVQSISKCKHLYKKLIVRVHPDKFLDERVVMANDLTARITKAKRNYNELVELEKEVKDFLEKKD